MSLYNEAAAILTETTSETGSLKSVIYNSKQERKSQPATLYALIIEVAKWDVLLKEVIENAGLLALEPKLSPLISLLLVHDFLLSKRGIAAPAKHPLRLAIDRNKSRLQAEFTKSRLRRKCTTVEELRKKLLAEKGPSQRHHPRWVRVNQILSDMKQLDTTFANYEQVYNLEDLAAADARKVMVDSDIPYLIALPATTDLTATAAYKSGHIIIQDKASCLPAHLLLDSEEEGTLGDALDGCAAPGNKTTHLAAMIHARNTRHKVFACERDATRSKTLQKMISIAGAAKIVRVMARQDFLALDPNQEELANVTHLLLDPSCSGSGILGREDIPQLALPEDTKIKNIKESGSKKRKRGGDTDTITRVDTDHGRLERLAGLQSRIVEHAMSFPAATKITYSTCSIHTTENEGVVARVLQSKVAQQRGWRVLPRKSHPSGLRAWKNRGVGGGYALNTEQLDACIRCYPNDENGTMGFFLCGFIRDPKQAHSMMQPEIDGNALTAQDGDEEWEGFSDS